MQIVTDYGADLSEEQKKGLNIHYIPLNVTINGESYVSGVSIDNSTFYRLLAETNAYPATSQPAPGDFAKLYRELAQHDPEILSIHISSGLSGTVNAARMGAEMVPEAHVTIIDSKTLSCPLGWQVQAAAKAVQVGWPVEKIVHMLNQIQSIAEGYFTVSDLKYLIHGGRIGHLKGLIGSALRIKPVIGVEKKEGKYIDLSKEFSYTRAIGKVVETISKKMPVGTPLRIQLLHGYDLEGIKKLKEQLEEKFECLFEEVVQIAPSLGAHTGPGMVGLAVAPLALFAELGLGIVPVS